MSTHVSRAGLHRGPVHVAGGQVGGGSEYSVSIRGLLLLFLLTWKGVGKSDVNIRAARGRTVNTAEKQR